MTTSSKVIYGVECVDCKKRMFSFHVHDFKLCGCPNETMVDGGRSYLRYGWKDNPPRKIKLNPKRDFYPPGPPPKDDFPYPGHKRSTTTTGKGAESADNKRRGVKSNKTI